MVAQMTKLHRWARPKMELEKSLEDAYCKNLLTKLWVLSLEKKMLRGSLLTLYNCLKGGYSQVEIGLFSQETSERIRGDTFRLDIRK